MKKRIKNNISWAKFLAFFATKQKRKKKSLRKVRKNSPATNFSRRKYFKFYLRAGLRVVAHAKLGSVGRKINRKGSIDFENVVTMRKTLLLTSPPSNCPLKISNQKK